MRLTAGNALRVPEKLFDIIISYDILVIFLPSHKFAIDHLVTLILNKPVKRLDDSLQIKTLRDGLWSALTLGQPVIIICTLEDETQTFRSNPTSPQQRR